MPLYSPKRLASWLRFDAADTDRRRAFRGVINALTSSLVCAWAQVIVPSTAAAIGSSRNPWFACMSFAPNQRRKNAGGSRFAPPSGLLLPWMSVWQIQATAPLFDEGVALGRGGDRGGDAGHARRAVAAMALVADQRRTRLEQVVGHGAVRHVAIGAIVVDRADRLWTKGPRFSMWQV